MSGVACGTNIKQNKPGTDDRQQSADAHKPKTNHQSLLAQVSLELKRNPDVAKSFLQDVPIIADAVFEWDLQ